MKAALLALSLIALAGTTMTAGASAQPPLRTVSIGLTAKTANEWPDFVAQTEGFFAANGLNADVIYTGSSAAGAQQLTGGSLDISEVSSTQVVEAIQGGAPITTILSRSEKAPYGILGKKGITSIAGLKGKTIIVGGPNDITRVFMDKILANAKLAPDAYTYTYAGATGERFAALLSGGVDAAILMPPFSFRAASQGYPMLDEVVKYFPTFPFDGFCVRTNWAPEHRDIIVAFVKAYVQSIRWLYDPANRTKAIKLLSDATNASNDDATATYDLFVTKLHLFSRTGLSHPADVAQVLDALVKTNELKPPVPPPAKFFDNRYVEEATAQLKARP